MELKYRTYKNNIYGVRYKKFYIIPSEGKTCDILDNQLYVFKEGFEDKEDAAWFIDKTVANDDERKVLNILYSKEIAELTEIMMKYYGKTDPASKYIYNMAKRIRDRKNDNKEW